MAGGLNFARTADVGRAGRAPLRPFYDIEARRGRKMDPRAKWALDWWSPMVLSASLSEAVPGPTAEIILPHTQQMAAWRLFVSGVELQSSARRQGRRRTDRTTGRGQRNVWVRVISHSCGCCSFWRSVEGQKNHPVLRQHARKLAIQKEPRRASLFRRAMARASATC